MKENHLSFDELERKKGVLFEIGLIVSLALVFFAFQVKVTDKSTGELSRVGSFDVPEEIIPVTEHQKKPPPPPTPAIIPIVSIVDDNDDADHFLMIDAGADENTEMDLVPDIIEIDVEEPAADDFFYVVETMPSFPGGHAALYQFLAKNLVYPELARETGVHGRVYVEFTVATDGKVTDILLKRGIGGGCDEEALRVVSIMPDWNPGKQRGVPVRVRLTLPVNFKLRY